MLHIKSLDTNYIFIIVFLLKIKVSLLLHSRDEETLNYSLWSIISGYYTQGNKKK